MNPGREFDALVAEKVMGWKPFKKKWVSGIHEGYADRWIDQNSVEVQGDLPMYSTDIAAAWEVIDKLKVIPYQNSDVFTSDFTTPINIQYQYNDRWLVHWSCGPMAEGESIAHAVCLAALKLAGVKWD